MAHMWHMLTKPRIRGASRFRAYRGLDGTHVAYANKTSYQGCLSLSSCFKLVQLGRLHYFQFFFCCYFQFFFLSLFYSPELFFFAGSAAYMSDANPITRHVTVARKKKSYYCDHCKSFLKILEKKMRRVIYAQKCRRRKSPF